MAMKLLAHVLRSATPGGDPGEPFAIRRLDLRRWVFRELVVRRDEFAPWGPVHPASTGVAAPARRESAAEPLWPDTQPGCHR